MGRERLNTPRKRGRRSALVISNVSVAGGKVRGAPMHRILVVYGTRPEAIKLAPVIQALEASTVLEPIIVVTGQHRSMLDQVDSLFGITPKHDLDLIRDRPN